MKKFVLIICAVLISFFYKCNTTETPPDDGNNQPDTTTQNFTFETYEFGDGGESSLFNDVWIFDENNIWAVGYIGPSDLGDRCNILQWDGTKWNIRGRQFDSGGIEGIWALDSSHIYFAVGGLIKYENGTLKCTP